jgi:hypothetical protein
MKKRLVVLLSLTAVCGQALGQIMSNPSQWYINNQMYSTRVFNSMVANSMLMRKGGKAATKITPAASKATAFKPAASILPKLLASKTEGQNRTQMERFFQSHIDLYRQTAAKDGFPANDLAYAFEYFVVNNYHLYHVLIGSPNGVSMVQERAVYNQFKQILASNASIKKMTNKEKQEAAEVLAILFGVSYNGYLGRNQGSKGEDVYRQCREMAKQGLEKLLGTSIDNIKITNKGIEL